MKEMEQNIKEVVADITERYRAAGYFPSACVRVFDQERTLAVACVGEAGEDSLFDVASLTKIATATMILRLISAGRLDLHAPVAEVFPEIAGDEYLTQRLAGITVYHLLTHTSTIVDWYPFYAHRGEPFAEVLKHALQHTDRMQGMVYSDINFMLLGRLVERLYGKPLDVCLQEELVEPLGLGKMMYRPGKDLPIVPSSYGNPIEERMCAERHIPFDDFRSEKYPLIGEDTDGNCNYYFDGVCGLAGIFATAEAYERLCRYYMNTEDPLLIEAQRERPDAPTRGLGFQTGLSYPHGCGHTGFTGTAIYFSREYNIGVVSMTNRLFYREQNPNGTWEYRRVLHEAVLAMGRSRA